MILLFHGERLNFKNKKTWFFPWLIYLDEENMLNTQKVNDEENIQSERQQFTNSDDKIQHEENELTEITTDTMPIGESVEKNETSSSSSSGKK